MNTFLSTVRSSHLTALCQNIRAPLPESGRVRGFFLSSLPKKHWASESNVRYPPDVDVFTYVGLFMTQVNRIPAFLRGWSTCLLKSRDGDSMALRPNPSFGWDVKPRSWLSVVIQNPIGLWPSWPPNNPHICWLASSLCLLSTSKLACGGHSGVLWLPSHHPGGCCTLVVDAEIPPDIVECFECLEKAEKRYINVIHYYY